MCGVCGFTGLRNDELLTSMLRVINHRGPDETGKFINDKISFGHKRLSIIDIESGSQPIFNEDKSIIIIYNGECYNYLELKQELLSKGHIFYTKSDTEVLVHLYEEYGDEFVKKINGMFAFALWDQKSEKLLLARDRIGIKPLYYTLHKNNLFFSSEIKSILQHREIPREIDYKVFDHYITFRYGNPDRTMFKDIFNLAPGHILTFKNKRINKVRYWDIEKNSININKNEYEDYLLELLKKSIKRRLISDVPLGVLLSGGVDSNSIVGIMKKVYNKPVETFSVGFGIEKHKDELTHTRFTSKIFDTQHHELIVNPKVENILPNIIWSFDEPNADPAAVPTYLISQLAKKHVTVVLSGEGSDEQFAGYERSLILLFCHKYIKKIPNELRNLLVLAVKMIPDRLLDFVFKYSSSLGNEGVKRLSYLMDNIEDIGKSFISVSSVFDGYEKTGLYSKDVQNEIDMFNLSQQINNEYFRSVNTNNILYKLLYYENMTRLPADLLMKVDRMTMAHSLEGRVPFLDHEIIEFAATIPDYLKINKLKEKYILRQSVKKILPKEIYNRKKDHFFVPIHFWLANELKPLLDYELDESRIKKQGIFNYKFINWLMLSFKEGKLVYARQLWNLLVFQMWYRMFIEENRYNL